MALINCHECGKQVSTESKTCPACGAKVRIPKKPMSKFTKALLVTVGVAMLAGIIGQQAADNADRAAKAALSPEQQAQENARRDKESRLLTIAALGARSLKKSAKDPQTFEFTGIIAHPNSSVCYEYRAKNSFNAILPGEAVLVDGQMHLRESSGNEFVRAWNKNCTRADGTDVTRLVARLLERV